MPAHTPQKQSTLSSGIRSDSGEIGRAIDNLFEAGDVVEVRILKTRVGVVAGYFNDFAKMATAIQKADEKYRPLGIYYTLNPVNPALLGRAYNRLKERSELTTADNNIVRRRWLPVDLDPIRPSGISSSDEEHESALSRARLIATEMQSEWGEPILADSGNGAHLLYGVDLPNDSDALRLVAAALTNLDRRFSDSSVKVDLTSSNAARIWKAYGTVARKGDSIPDRPHRLSRIVEVPRD